MVVSVEEGMILSREVEIDWQVMASGCACLTKLGAGFPQWTRRECLKTESERCEESTNVNGMTAVVR